MKLGDREGGVTMVVVLACILFWESMTTYVGCVCDHLHWSKQVHHPHNSDRYPGCKLSGTGWSNHFTRPKRCSKAIWPHIHSSVQPHICRFVWRGMVGFWGHSVVKCEYEHVPTVVHTLIGAPGYYSVQPHICRFVWRGMVWFWGHSVVKCEYEHVATVVHIYWCSWLLWEHLLLKTCFSDTQWI